MRRTLKSVVCLALACTVTVGYAACGNNDDETPGAGGQAAGQSGGSVRAAYTSFPDFLDPALSYTQAGWQSLWMVYTPLLTYRHAEGAEGSELIPGLAEALPEVSGGGKTYRLKLRDGLRYSDGSAVRASDFERTIQRVLNLGSGGSAFYMKIAGTETYVKDGKAKADISGIETNDPTGEITIRLSAPDGSFSNILAMNFAGLVPERHAVREPDQQPARGRRALQARERARQPRIRASQEPRVQHPRPAAGQARQDHGRGQQEPPSPDAGHDPQQDRLHERPAGSRPDPDGQAALRGQALRGVRHQLDSTYYFFLNERVSPFDKKKARQAVNYAIDKRALARLFAGLLEPGCNFLPPGVKGHQKIDPCPYGDPTQAPDVDKARQLIEQAGVKGDRVTVWGNDEPESKSLAEYLADVLNQIGLKAKPRIVAASVYFTTIGNQKTKAQVGFANWFQDFPHPSNFMFLIDGKSIQNTNNHNFGNVDDEQINSTLVEANRNPDINAVADTYAEVDRRLLNEAHLAPFGHAELTVFYSNRIDFADCTLWHPVYNLDFSGLCVKK